MPRSSNGSAERGPVAVNRNRLLAVAVAALAGLLILVGGYGVWPTALAALVMYALLRMGMAVIGTFARPVPGPPPPGELRRVRIQFRCSICGTEVRMTVANDEMPDPPRHCQEDMELVAPVVE
jgi:hypothetical protein